MADSRVDLEENSKYRVAYDLMKEIAILEGKWGVPSEGGREYLMELYRQCFEVIYRSKTFEEVSKPKNQRPNSGIFGV